MMMFLTQPFYKYLSFGSLAVAACFFQGAANAAEDAFTSDDALTSLLDIQFGPWQDSQLLMNRNNENFGAKWRIDTLENVNADGESFATLTLLLAANSVGWLGFGIGESSSGSMLGSDIVVASIDDVTGVVEVSDRHVPWVAYPMNQGNSPFPLPDDQQDWTALGGRQTENGTAIVLQRKLDTQDLFDRPIDPSASTPVIFAFGESFGYHGSRRGVGNIIFSKHQAAVLDLPTDIDSYLDVTMPNVLLPQGLTDAFVHVSLDLGDVDDIAGIDFDAISPSPHFMHHLTMYTCSGPDNTDWLKYTGKYKVFDKQPPVSYCHVAFGWALGGSRELFPPNAAFRGVRYIILQAHYNLPRNGTDSAGRPTYAGAGTIDASGLRLYTTSTPRKYKAETLHIHYVEDGVIPAQQNEVHYESVCVSDCTKPLPRPLNIFSGFLHMHSHGKQIWAAQYDVHGRSKGLIVKTDFWNFQFQKTVSVDAVLTPGDEIRLHCVFDTSKVDTPLQWGEQSAQEMCLVFLYYYVEEEEDKIPDDSFSLLQCGGMHVPWLGMEHGASFCNNDPVITGTEMLSNADPLPCNVASNWTFPLHIDFANDVGDGNGYKACAYSFGTSSLLATIAFGALLLCVFVLGYTDVWTRFKVTVTHGRPPCPTQRESASNDTEGSEKEDREQQELLINYENKRKASEAVQFAKDNPSSDTLLLDRFYENVQLDPDRLQYAWLDAKTDVIQKLTRKELWDQSRDLAVYLQKQYDLQPGQRAMIVYPFGIDFLVGFVALLRLGCVIVSVYPPNPENLETEIPKFSHFVRDSGATVALTTSMFHRIVQASKLRYKSWPTAIQWVPTDKKRPKAPASWEDHVPRADDVALLQYTSGSTSDPKGVMITQRNMMMQCSYLERCHHVYGGTTMKQSRDVVSVSWTPAYHDMGLFGGFLSYMPSGGTAYGMSPITFLRDPPVWVKAMRRYSATCTNGPSFSFALTCKRLQAQKDKHLGTEMPRIPSLKFVVLGAEPSDIRLLDSMDKLMGIDKESVASMYGLAEHVLAATSGSSQRVYPDKLWSVGNLQFSKALGDVTVRVVNPETCQEVPTGTQGEIWISSPCVAAGYWGKPEYNASVFEAECRDAPRQKFLRTGDIGIVRDNELFVVSRLKDLIIVNGKNIAPTDIEHAVEEKFSTVIRPGCSAAFQITPQAALLICEMRDEARKSTSFELLVQQMKVFAERTVDGIELENILLVAKGSVLKTSSGKVRRKAMKQLWESNGIVSLVNSSAPLQNGELCRAQSLEELFHLVGVEDFELTLVENGVDSMKLVQVVEVAREKFGVQLEYSQASALSVADLMANATTKGNETILRVPLADTFADDIVTQLLPAALMRLFRQTLVLCVVGCAIFCSIVPPASYIRRNWVYDSVWWVQNYRAGPLVALAFPIWMLSYSAICIILKWTILGRQRSEVFVPLWSGSFARYWTVERLVHVWEVTVGLIVADTPLKNAFYILLGARVSLTARIHTAIRCWDLVDIGPRSEIKGNLFPRRMHFTGVQFAAIKIGSDCFIGSGAVVMDGVTIKDTVRVSNRTVVPPGATLASTNGTWSGVPCAFHGCEKTGERLSPIPLSSKFWSFVRACFPPLFILAIICASWLANELVYLPPKPSFDGSLDKKLKNAHEYLFGMAIYFEHWNMRAYALSISYLVCHEVAGLIMLFTCVLTKWAFVSPYLVDRVEPLILRFYFPYLLKTIFHQWWHQLFGIRIGSGAHIVANRMVASASNAHRVRLGKDSVLFSMTCSPRSAPPGVASSVWEWIASRFQLASPWSTIFVPPDIIIGDNCECAAGSYLEDGVKLEDNSGTSTMSRVTANTTIRHQQRAVGNPAELLIPSKPKEDNEFPPLSPLAAELFRFALVCLHLGWIFFSAVAIMEFLRDWGLPNDWSMEWTMPAKVLVAYVLATLSLLVEILLAKKLLFRRTQIASIPLQSYRGIIFHHLQVIGQPIELLIWPLFGGTYPLALYYKMLGANIEGIGSSIFINSSGYLDPGDADNTTVRPFAVMDEGSHCVCHRVDYGRLNQGHVMLHSGSILHPGSGLMMGSLGKGSQLFPLSKALRETHTGDDQLWIGLPSVLARAADEKGETPGNLKCAAAIVNV